MKLPHNWLQLSHKAKVFRRFLGSFFAINKNRLSGKTYAPVPHNQIAIETSQRCNLACRFCAYPIFGPGKFMSVLAFANCVNEAVQLGYRSIILTPMLGEFFADPNWRKHLDHLEMHSDIDTFFFYTNMILPSVQDIEELSTYKKLSAIHISIYGYDADSFTAVTQKPARQFDRLLINLATLVDLHADKRLQTQFHFNIRSVPRDLLAVPKTTMDALLKRFSNEIGAEVSIADEYDSWGGKIASDDVAWLGIQITNGNEIYMHGACIMLFSMPQIKADGTVHACACRDVDGSLQLGNLSEAPLAEILSAQNPKFHKIVNEQQQGKFGPNCRSCSMYRSVYDHRASKYDLDFQVTDIDTALRNLD